VGGGGGGGGAAVKAVDQWLVELANYLPDDRPPTSDADVNGFELEHAGGAGVTGHGALSQTHTHTRKVPYQGYLPHGMSL